MIDNIITELERIIKERLESFQKDYSKLYQVIENKGYIKELDQLKTELEQEKALKETYLACYKAKHDDIEGELFKLREYKKSKQASYEELQKRWNEVELENRKLKSENEELKGIRDRNFLSALEEQKRADKFSKTLMEIKEIAEKKCLRCTNFCNDDNIKFCVIKQILQKISEVIKDE